jgi:cytochrome c556
LTIVCAVSMGVAVASEDAPPQHQKWMKDLGNQMGALRKGIDVEKNATDMQAILKEVAVWWQSRNSQFAGKACQDSADGAAQIVKAAGDKAGIAAGMKLVGAGCKGCHDNHREKISETVYKIK